MKDKCVYLGSKSYFNLLFANDNDYNDYNGNFINYYYNKQ